MSSSAHDNNFLKPHYGPRSPRGSRHRTSRHSVTSWISSLAGSHVSHSPPAIPISLPPIQSPGAAPRIVTVLDLNDPPSEVEDEVKELKPATDESGIQVGPERADEAASPTTPTAATRKGRTRSIASFVSGLKSLPRAVTHGQLYDRVSAGRESTRSAHAGEPPSSTGGGAEQRFKSPAHQPLPSFPFPFPILLAPPFPTANVRSPMSVRAPPSKWPSEAEGSSSDAGTGFVGFMGELKNMPWIAPRVAVDYVPGERAGERSSESWYTIAAPFTPSDITDPCRVLPEPWFPPAAPAPASTTHKSGEEEKAGNADGDGDGDEPVEQRLARAQVELQEKSRALSDLRQVVEHQKLHISTLETELADLRQAGEGPDVSVHRRRSSTRRSLQYRSTRDSVRTVTSARRGSASRPPSAYYDD